MQETRRPGSWWIAGAALLVAGTVVQPSFAGPCTRMAMFAWEACRYEVRDDAAIEKARCTQINDRDEQLECFGSVRPKADLIECDEQRDARLELCDELGEDRYDPSFDPADFDTVFDDRNPFLPLTPGNVWEYAGDGETTRIEVLDETKNIEGVTCVVVNDVVSEDGQPIEDTDDWIALALNGDAHYCGEISLNYELFEGDDPEEAELVDIEGSWKAGRDDAKSGVLMFAMPVVGALYRQEFSVGDAEDMAEVISTTYAWGEDEELDELVPQDLAELLCDGDCLVTREFTPLEPDGEEYKYYAPGIGLFLEVNREDEAIVRLVGCNMAPACDALPEP